MKKKFVLFLSLTMLLFVGCAGEAEPRPADATEEVDRSGITITFANAGWDSLQLHNAIAGLIAVEAFGYGGWTEIAGSSPILHEGMNRGEIDVHMENWVENADYYIRDLEEGLFTELGINFNDNMQGLFVPRFVIEGSPERGIEPLAPTLRTVQDLLRYPHVFPDDENPGRGRIYGAIPGWAVDEIMYNKFIYNGLDAYFEYFRPGSEAALNAAFVAAYERGIPIVGYNWEPTWLIGMYDFVLLEDFPFTTQEDLDAGRTAFAPVTCTVATSNQFAQDNPEFSEFLSRYSTSSAMISEALAFMQYTGASHDEVARWFLQTFPHLLDEWLDPDQAQAVRSAL